MSAEVLRLRVLEGRRLSPHFHRVVVGGDDLRKLENLGYDQWFRLFFRRPDQSELTLPFDSADSWYQQFLDCPESSRPECRNYTVRHFRPSAGELDIDFVLHPDASGNCDTPAARWADRARPGESLGLLDQGITFDAPAGRPLLLVGDEAALPAIEGILRSLDTGTRGRAVLEVPTEADIRELTAPAGVTIDWVPRAGSGAARTGAGAANAGRGAAQATPGVGQAIPGAITLARLRDEPAPTPDTSVFVAGESELATGLRRHLVAGGHDKSLIHFSGYWKAERVPIPA